MFYTLPIQLIFLPPLNNPNLCIRKIMDISLEKSVFPGFDSFLYYDR